MNKQKCELDFLLNILFCGKWQGCQSWHTPGTDRHWQHNMNTVWKWNRYISRIISNKLAQKPRESYSVFVADLQNSLKFLVIQLKQKQTKKRSNCSLLFCPWRFAPWTKNIKLVLSYLDYSTHFCPALLCWFVRYYIWASLTCIGRVYN